MVGCLAWKSLNHRGEDQYASKLVRAGAEGTAGVLTVIKAVLKPGGVFGVIDHVGKPDADNAAPHRIQEELVVKAVTDAGFVVEARSDILRNPEDNHTLRVFDPEIRGKTDRFVLRLRKPE